jgi:hypothetical protein
VYGCFVGDQKDESKNGYFVHQPRQNDYDLCFNMEEEAAQMKMNLSFESKTPRDNNTTENDNKEENRPKYGSDKKKGSRLVSFLIPYTATQQSVSLDEWNVRFQMCLERLHRLNSCSALEERIDANIELMHLSEDFVHASRTVGKIIISEVFM